MPLLGCDRRDLQNNISRKVPKGKSQANGFIESNTNSKMQMHIMESKEIKNKSKIAKIKEQIRIICIQSQGDK